MKKILLFVSCFLFALTSCEIDNYEGPDASIHGSILDEQTGELVGSDMENGNAIKVREHGFTNATDQTWYITNTGEYRNNMVFAATYDVRFENGNFYPFEVKDFVVKSGDNVYDFKVIPYIRVKSPKVEKNGNVITATFSLEAGKQEVKLKEIQLFAFSDMWVGNNVKLTLNGGTDKQVFSPSTAINSADIYTLSIDLGQNADVLKYSKNYYFRIGALADVSGVGTVRHNYAPVADCLEYYFSSSSFRKESSSSSNPFSSSSLTNRVSSSISNSSAIVSLSSSTSTKENGFRIVSLSNFPSFFMLQSSEDKIRSTFS